MSTPASLDQFFNDLAGEGRSDGAEGSFTLESGKAREKLRKFALEHPENYFLMLIAGLYALGSRKFSLTVDADDLILVGDRPLPRAPFGDIWSHLAGGSGDPAQRGYRLLAIALLTSVRFTKMSWSVASTDSQGSWRYTAVVKDQNLTGETVEAVDEPGFEGVRIWAKRKSLVQVTGRFLQRLTSRVAGRDCAEQALVKQRVFLPRGGSFRVNGQEIVAAQASGSEAFAVLTCGEAQPLVRATHTFQLKKSLSVCAILDGPQNPQASTLHWIWNGLQMDVENLEMSYPFCRAYVWAPDLRPDLSMQSLVDNRDKQNVLRGARDAVRELLKALTLAVTPELAKAPRDLGPDLAWSKTVVLKALNQRIDMGRNRNRLASFNTALIGCPLFWGSASETPPRHYSFGELWERLEKKLPVATFRSRQEWTPVPDWANRPLVLYCEEDEYEVLKRKFGDHLDSAVEVVERLQTMHEALTGQGERLEQAPPQVPGETGSFSFQGLTVTWFLSHEKMRATKEAGRGALTVTRQGRVYFVDETFLPRGLELRVEAQWEPDFRGELRDRDLAERLQVSALQALVADLAAGKVADEQADALQSFLMRPLGRLRLRGDLPEAVWETSWLRCQTLDGVIALQSPAGLVQTARQLNAPLYFAGARFGSRPELQEGERASLRLPRLSRAVTAEAETFFRYDLVDGRALARVERFSESYQSKVVRTVAINPPTGSPPGLTRIVLHCPEQGRVDTDLLVHHLVRGLDLGMRRFKDAPLPGRLTFCWERAWPRAQRGCLWPAKDQEQVESEMESLLRRLVEWFWEEASDEEIASCHSGFLSRALMMTLDDNPVLLQADLKRVTADSIEAGDGVALYFTDFSRRTRVDKRAIFAPFDYADYLPLIRDDLDWRPAPVGERAPMLAKTEKAKERHQIDPPPDSPVPKPVPVRKPPAPERELLPIRVTEQPVRQPAEAAPVEGEGTPQERLVGDLMSWPEADTIPHLDDFVGFLKALHFEPGAQALALSGPGRPVLGERVAGRLENPEDRLIVLSALYSVFNRSRAHVEDAEERIFHQLLLRRSLQLWPGKDPA